jgi:hypothetical protein
MISFFMFHLSMAMQSPCRLAPAAFARTCHENFLESASVFGVLCPRHFDPLRLKNRRKILSDRTIGEAGFQVNYPAMVASHGGH